jgi:uncharacterized DUF497 family protein
MALLPELFAGVTGFQWDEGNSEKNWRHHGVTQAEAEQVFFNHPLLVREDPKHSVAELRYFALGRADSGGELTVVLTIRGSLFRVISARPMGRRERRVYVEGKGA